MFPVDGDFIRKIAPHFSGAKGQAQDRIIGAISPVFAATLDAFDINTKLRIAHFMGQVTHECAGFRTTEEFASGAAYEGRKNLGNTHPGDGKRYKGRGLLQLTGRANYKTYGEKLGLPLEDQPEMAAEPVISLKIACEYWRLRKINAACDDDNLVRVTKFVNGGTNGLADRSNYLIKAKTVLAEMDAIVIATREGGTSVVLRRGSDNDAVGELQELLRKNGLQVTVDNNFGAATELAVKIFQKKGKLSVDGVVGQKTWDALRG